MSLHIPDLCILLDLDGTAYLPLSGSIEKANNEFGINLTVENAKYYEWFHDTMINMHRKQYGKEITSHDVTKGYFGEDVLAKAMIMPGMQKLVKKLVSMGIVVHACTSREKEILEDVTKERVRTDYPWISEIYMRSRDYDSSFEFKKDIIAITNPILVVDDYAETVLKLANVSPPSTYFALVDGYWNQYVEDEGNNPVKIGYDGMRIRRVGDCSKYDKDPDTLKNQILQFVDEILGK